MSLIIHTMNSVYEVGDKAVRRLNGDSDPTPRQGQDGDWREFLTCTEPKIGESFVIGWRIEDGVLKSTITSMVTKIEEVENDAISG